MPHTPAGDPLTFLDSSPRAAGRMQPNLGVCCLAQGAGDHCKVHLPGVCQMLSARCILKTNIALPPPCRPESCLRTFEHVTTQRHASAPALVRKAPASKVLSKGMKNRHVGPLLDPPPSNLIAPPHHRAFPLPATGSRPRCPCQGRAAPPLATPRETGSHRDSTPASSRPRRVRPWTGA